MTRKICPYCFNNFISHPKVGDHQICCGAQSCKKQHKKELDRKWRQKNPDYFKGRYNSYLKPWLKNHPGYLKDYRRKMNSGKCKSDIQEQLTYGKTISYPKILTDIQEQLNFVHSMHYIVFATLHDIKEQLIPLYPLHQTDFA